MKDLQYETPLQELSFLLHRIEDGIREARQTYRNRCIAQQRQVQAAIAAKSAPGYISSMGSAVRGYWNRSKPAVDDKKAQEETDSGAETPKKSGASTPERSGSLTPPRSASTDPTATYVDMASQDQMVEDLRRVIELVVIGENMVTAARKKEKEEAYQRRKSGDADEEVSGGSESFTSTIPPGADAHIQVFELFFERQALEMIVHLLMGESFDLVKHEKEDMVGQNSEKLEGITFSPNDTKLLPPIPVAAQAIQSISILIQNVSRATSLYAVLSNNLINTLIGLPLHLYSAAERSRPAKPHTMTNTVRTELTTQFVTFLKSLALRMNVQTLQFFLKYPSEALQEDLDYASSSHVGSEGGSSSELGVGSERDDHHDALFPPRRVNRPSVADLHFPLYERALEFCAAHNDSFVRVTAMNICLNTLRLTTVVEPQEEDDDDEEEGLDGGADPPSQSSDVLPDGNLHNAQALPFRERFLIAQYACIPSRVEKLISPICMKLAERWNSLDEQIKEIDSYKLGGSSGALDLRGVRNEKAARAKEKVKRDRLIRAFKQRAADLQDELLLLDDVLRVGLVVLNEQLIEMMLATFVYPLLLQPLLLYYKRLEPALERSRSSLSDHPFGGYNGDTLRVHEMVASAAGPAKTSLFTLASAFQFLTNRPLLRLLFTALFHPLSPDSTSVPTVRSRLEVASFSRKGRPSMRLDRTFLDSDLIPDERTTYAFGTDSKNRRRSKTASSLAEYSELSEACVFVLAPALAEVLEFKGQSYDLIARTKPNPYRHALLSCLRIPDDFPDIRQLSVCVFDSALPIFDGSFASQILLGTDLKTFDDDIPLDERNLDSEYAHTDNDRGIGTGIAYDSRHSLARKKGGGSIGSDMVGEVVTALCGCVVFASRAEDAEEWEVGYNTLAAHALLYGIRHNSRAMALASKTIEHRWSQATALVTARTSSILSPMGGTSIVIRGAPSVNDPRYDEKVFNALLDILLFGSPEHKDTAPALEDLVCMQDDEGEVDLDGYCTAIAAKCSFNDLCRQVGTFLLAKDDTSARSREHETLKLKREGCCCLFKLDALLSLLRDLGATGAIAIRDEKLASLVVARDRTTQHLEMLNIEMSRRMYCVLSTQAVLTFFGMEDSESHLPEHGSRIELKDCLVASCVCEAPANFAHLFVTATGVVAKGVSWQTLRIVIKDDTLIFVQPGEGGVDGRVITACLLERVWVEKDSDPDPSSPARRLLLSHTWFNKHPPNMFLFDSLPESEKCGPFLRPKAWTSHFDVWFQNQESSDQAFSMLSREIFASKSKRGQRAQEFLSFVPT